MAIEASAVRLPRMTEEEFEAWCDEDTHAEYVDGEVILMAPANLDHQRILRFLTHLIDRYLEERPVGEMVPEGFQVRLRAGLRRVPDLLFVRNENAERFRATYLEGGPDAAWEIVSTDSEERDWRDKFREYAQFGVGEYWVIAPEARVARLFRLDVVGEYQEVAEDEGRLVSAVLPGFWLRPEWLWPERKPKVRDCLREMGVGK